MVTFAQTFEEYRRDVAAQNMSKAELKNKLLTENHPLHQRAWSDEQIRSIPDGLAEFAFTNSAALRQEFLALETFMAYRRSLQRAKR